MDSGSKSLLVISANPKISGHRLPAHARRPSASRKPGCAPRPRSSHRLFGITEIEGGFPHSEIPGSKPVRGSPGLIAAYHVLHRLSAPRHPPNALKTLDRSHRQRAPSGRGFPVLASFRSRKRTRPSRFDSAVYGSDLGQEAGNGVGLSKRPVLLQTHPGAQAVKLEPMTVNSSSGDN